MTASPDPIPPLAPPRRVLVVDDEPLLLDILADEFEDGGFGVLRAYGSADALSLLQSSSQDIDLLVTDIRLPGPIDGWAIAQEARRLNPALPVIYVTGFYGKAANLVTGGIVVPKPYRPSALMDIARRFWA